MTKGSSENLTRLLRRLIANFIADFALQTDAMTRDKKGDQTKQQILKYGYRLMHSLIHAAMSYVLVAQWSNWIIPTVVFISHFLIDSIKSTFKKDNIGLYIIDQLAHLSVLIV